MEQRHTQVWLADYDSSDSEECDSSPIAITNDSDFFHMNEEDQVLVSSLYKSRWQDDGASCVNSRQREEAHQEAVDAPTAGMTTNCSIVPIDERNPPANPRKHARPSQEQTPASDSQDNHNHQTSCASHQQRQDNVQKEDSSVANIASSHLPAKRAKYALEEDQLSPVMLSLLKQVKEFFVKPASLERVTAHVAQTTILKALERVRCEYILFYYMLI